MAGQRGDIWTFKFVIMDIVTFKTAKRLKEAGFPQPAPAFGQFWFDEKGALFFVVDAFDEIPIPLDGAWLIEKGGDVIHVERVVFGSSLAYAPSATDILRKLPGHSIGRYNTSKSAWDSPEMAWICVSPKQKELIHDTPAEAAALAWLSIKKT